MPQAAIPLETIEFQTEALPTWPTWDFDWLAPAPEL